MKKLISVFAVILIVSFTSCTEVNKENSRYRAINGGEVITRNDNHKYIVLYDASGNVASMCHAGECPCDKK